MKNIYLTLLIFFTISANQVLSQTPNLVQEGNRHGTNTDIDRIIKINSTGSDVILFPSNDEFNGRELWKYEAATGNSVVIDLVPGPSSSLIIELTQFNDKAYFVNHSFGYGTELWISDGTSAGTHLYFDVLQKT